MRLPNWAKFSKIGIKEHIAAFCLTVFLAVAMLTVAAFLPQTPIRDHVADSIPLVSRDMENRYLFDNSIGSKLDVDTDVMMLCISLSTNDRYLGSILTNPVHGYDDLDERDDLDQILAELSYDTPSDSVWFYTRYWMGFRVMLRLALTFFTYAQIKRYMAFAFFALFAGVLCSVAKHANARIAFFFALSIILVRPHVMATSMQLSCCFFIAFAAMLLIPWLHCHEKWETLFFMELGMATMYFDFYTVPLVTLGFPLLYLWVLKQEKGTPGSWKLLLKDMVSWLLGYGCMWIAKLTLTSLLTSQNALKHGFQSFFSRVGIQKDAELAKYYSLEAAFEGIRKAVFSDEMGAVVYLTCAAVILTVVLYKVLRRKTSLADLRNAAPYLLLAVLPLIWFVITKQPVAIHYFFQYRSIALTHWGAAVFLHYLLPAKSKELTITQ